LSYSPERRGKMAAISRAVKAAHGEILVFSDANNFFSSYALRYLVNPFADPRVGSTTGAKHIRDEDDSLSSSEGLYWRYESWIKKNESLANTCTAAAGEILALRKELFPAELSGVVNDDFYILLSIIRQGYRVVYTPRAESWERVSSSAQDEVKRRARITAGRFQALAHSLRWMPWNNPVAVWQIVSHKYFRLFIPITMLLVFISNVFLAVNSLLDAGQSGLFYLWLLVLQILFYLLAFLGQGIHYRGVWRILYLPVFLVNSNIATLRGLIRHFGRKQGVSWDRVNRR
jgi:cellulose synthase/poly-beta-1,6-N-acetylglucosamine synthase-like glycosyltransferase